ncbi:MAG: fused MFS/spermidine synthase [Luteolibacter sp.]
MPLSKAATVDTAFQRVEVWKSENQVEFRVAGAIHAWWQRDRFLTGLAWDNLAAAALLRPAGPPRSVLMLGLAGGTAFRILRHLLPEVELVAVDIDPGIVELARDHMDLDATRIEIHLGDAYEWLKKNRRRFDVVIDDVYLAGKTDVFRPHAWNGKHLDTLRDAVAPGGLLAANLVTGAGHRIMQSHSRRVLLESFPVVRSVTTPQSLNETLVAGDDVLSGRALREWEAEFPQRRDRALWDILRVRKL